MTDTTQEQSLQQAIVRFKNSTELANDFTRGDATVDVVGADGTYPSLAKLSAQALDTLHLLQAIPIVNVDTDDMTLGMAVYSPDTGLGKLALAANITKKNVIGLVANDLILSQSGRGSVLSTGMLTGTVAQWEAATGLMGGLIPKATYYVDNEVPGRITPYPASIDGQYLCPVGYALTTTEFIIRIERPIAL